MSLDISLYEGDDEVFSVNITHNLAKMAREAELYRCMWRPEEIAIEFARQAIGPLAKGFAVLLAERERLLAFNPANGWGSWDGLAKVCAEYMIACAKHPGARIEVSR